MIFRRIVAAVAALVLLAGLLAAPPAQAQFTDQRTWAGTAGGTANALTLSVANYTAHQRGVVIRFIGAANNTSATTVAVSGLGAVALRKATPAGLVALSGSEILSGKINEIVYDGTFYQVLASPISTPTYAKTTAYTAASADCGGQLALGGSAFYVLTVGAASGFPTGCQIDVINTDTTRGKGISIDGLTACRMFPGQVFTITNSGSAWKPTAPCYRWTVSSPTFRVNQVSGSDNPLVSDCLATGAGACATFNAAVAIVHQYVDAGGVGVATVQADCEGQYTAGISVIGKIPGVFGIAFVGNAITPLSCIISLASGSSVASFQDGANGSLNGFHLNFSSGGSSLIQSRQGTIVDFLNMSFGNVSGSQISSVDGANINVLGVYSINGNASSHMSASGGGQVSIGGNTVTAVSTPNIGTLYQASAGGRILSQGGATTFTGSNVLGTQYNVGSCGVLTMGGSSLPAGLTAGNGPGTCGIVNP